MTIGAPTWVMEADGIHPMAEAGEAAARIYQAMAVRDGHIAADTKDTGEFLGLTASRAASTPDRQWIRSASNWHKLQPAQRRMPTWQEPDSAAPDNPVLVKRGGHHDLVNSAGLRLAGVTASWDGEHARQAMQRPDPARDHEPPRHGRFRSPLKSRAQANRQPAVKGMDRQCISHW